MLHKGPEEIGALEDVVSPLCIDVQSQGSQPYDACPSPGLFCNSLVDDHDRHHHDMSLSYGKDNPILDDMSFPGRGAADSALDHYLNFPTLQTSPAGSVAIDKSPSTSATIKQIPSGLPNSCARNELFVHTGSITSASQELYDLYLTPPSDNSTSSSEKGASGWLSPLHIAAQKGHARIVDILLQHNVDYNEQDSDGLTPIVHAVIGGYEDVVRSLLLHGARISNIEGQQRPSVLHWAVLHRRETLLRVLLNHSLKETTSIDSYDEFGRTPLHIAIDRNFETGVLMLLQFGADPKYKARKSAGEPALEQDL
ncbi:MAG: hypothetical protein L6R39_000248 [Caloplaca ligustica]|nr:MAG: hypothetical protein L6R39_000248 [Caloplaca ligustica]